MKHPMRDIPIAVYALIEGDGPEYIAKFMPFSTYPIFFKAASADEARKAARAFADDAADRNEAAFIARQEALQKARKARKTKGGAE